MNKLLLVFLSLSVSGSLLAGFLFALGPVVKRRLSETWQYYIWLVVILRFLLPFSPEFSVIGELSRLMNTPTAASSGSAAILDPGIVLEAPGDALPPPIEMPQYGDPGTAPLPEAPRAAFARQLFDNLWALWLSVALMLFVRKAANYQSFVRFIRLCGGTERITDKHILELYRMELAAAKVKRSLPLYRNDQVSSPMLIGMLRPSLVLPALEASDDELRGILRHELTHYKRLDFLYKWLVQIMLCLHWFNPLVYLIARRINKSCELSCDEAVVRSLDKSGRITYGNALLVSLTAQGGYSDFTASMTMSEDGDIVRERLERIMNFHTRSKPATALSILITLVMLCGAMATGAYAATQPEPVSQQQTANFSVMPLGKYTLASGDAVKANLSWNDVETVMLLHTDKAYNNDEILAALQGIPELPKPNYDNVTQEITGTLNLMQSPVSPFNREQRTSEAGTYYFYLIRYGFNLITPLNGKASYADQNGDEHLIWEAVKNENQKENVLSGDSLTNAKETEEGKGVTDLTIDVVSANIVVRLSNDDQFHFDYDSDSYKIKTTGNDETKTLTITTIGEPNFNYPSFVNIQIPNNTYQQITYLGDSAGMNLPSLNANTKISVKTGSFAITIPAGFDKTCDLSADTSSGVIDFSENTTNYTFSLDATAAAPVLPSAWEDYRHGQVYQHKEGNGAGKINATVNASSFVVRKEEPDATPISHADIRPYWVEKEYSAAELKELAISGILIDALSENIVLTQGGETLKLGYYEQEANRDYTLQNEENGGTRNLVLRRTSAATSDTTARPISINIPESGNIKTISIMTSSGSIALDSCMAENAFIETQGGQVVINGGAFSEFLDVKTNSGKALILGTVLPSRGTALESAKFYTENGAVFFQPTNSAWDYRYRLNTGRDAQIFVNGQQYQNGGGNINNFSRSQISIEIPGNGSLVVQEFSMGTLALDTSVPPDNHLRQRD